MLLALLAACDSTPTDPGDTGRDPVETGDTGDTGEPDEVAVRPFGVTLGCGAAAVEVDVVADGVVRVRRGAPRASWAVVAQAEPAEPVVWTTAATVTVDTAELRVVIDRATCRVRAFDADGIERHTELDELAWALPDDAHVFGLGERTAPLDRRGGRYRCWNTDAYDATAGGWPADRDPLYQCVPWMFTLEAGVAFGVFVDLPADHTWDVGASEPGVVRVETAAAAVDTYLVAGPTVPEVVERYTALTGRAPEPPGWALGFHQSRWGWADADTVLAVVDRFAAEALPLDAVWLDIQHLDGFRSFTWAPDGWADPAALTAALAERGVRAVAIVDPALKVDPTWSVYAEAVDAGFLLEDDAGPWVGEVWPGAAVFPDFSDPAARAWWGGLAADEVALGLGGLWLDMNEPSEFTLGTVPDTLHADGDGMATTMAEVHNVYGHLEAAATWEGLRAAAPDVRPFLLTRAAFAGTQRYAASWTGDAPSTWASLQATLPMLLGMGLSGQPWVGSDVGGYSGGASGELYARWMMLGVVSPFFRAHLTDGAADQYPWSFGTEVRDIARELLTTRRTMRPLWASLGHEAAETGAPPLRPLFWSFPDDEAAVAVDDQAMLGDWLLVAPVLEEGADTRDVYLPAGRWYERTTGAAFDGPGTVRRADLPLAAFPVFARAGAILPSGGDALTIELFPGPGTSAAAVWEDAGDGPAVGARTTWTATWSGAGVRIDAAREGELPAPRALALWLRRIDRQPSAVRVDGAALDPARWSWDPVDLSVHIELADAPSLSVEVEVDPALVELAPRVAMPFRVTVPDGTPTDAPICLASSADGWVSPTPLSWVSATEAVGTLTVPRGEYVRYKYTRGDWDTVEKWPGCVEADNRYELGRAAEKADTVWAWADGC